MMGFGLIIIVGLIGFVVYLFGGGANTASSFLSNIKNDKTALEILEERYARGEIEKDEFDTKKKDFSDI